MSTDNKLTSYFRWLLVLPGGLVSGFLVLFPLHWLLLFLFSSNTEPDIGSLRFFIGLFPNTNATSIEYLIFPAVSAFFYIIGGAKIAPKYKFKTAIILFVLYLITWAIIAISVIINGNFLNAPGQFSARTVLTLLGAILGLIEVKISNKKAVITA